MDNINGVLLLNKPRGISSNLALQQVKKIFQLKKAGHGGTLDPLADGLLIICIGQATKYINYIIDANKSYVVELKLGEQTSTGDSEGQILNINKNKISKYEFIQSVNSFVGYIDQIPPKYSAVKINGQPAYKYARKGIDITLKSRRIHIFEIKVLNFCYPIAKIYVNCSKGTYIRTLIEDIAKKSNTLAYVTNLYRNKIGIFDIQHSYTLDYLNNLKDLNYLNKIILPTEILLQKFPKIILDDELIIKLTQGKLVQLLEKYEIITPLCIFNNVGRFIGLVEPNIQKNYYKVLRLMSFNKN